jgi:hypothetical protein
MPRKLILRVILRVRPFQNIEGQTLSKSTLSKFYNDKRDRHLCLQSIDLGACPQCLRIGRVSKTKVFYLFTSRAAVMKGWHSSEMRSVRGFVSRHSLCHLGNLTEALGSVPNAGSLRISRHISADLSNLSGG